MAVPWYSQVRSEYFQKEFPYNATQVQADLAPLELRSEDQFIDLGCGCGYHVFEAAKVVKEAAGVDISPFQIDFAKKFNKDVENADFDTISFREMALADSYFTKGFAKSALHQLMEKEKWEFFERISTGFSKGALFLLSDVILFPGWEKVMKRFKAGVPNQSLPACLVSPGHDDVHPFDGVTLKKNFNKVGFQTIYIKKISLGHGTVLLRKS